MPSLNLVSAIERCQISVTLHKLKLNWHPLIRHIHAHSFLGCTCYQKHKNVYCISIWLNDYITASTLYLDSAAQDYIVHNPERSTIVGIHAASYRDVIA